MSWMSLQKWIPGIWREWTPETNLSNKSPFGGGSHLENIVSWNAGSPTSNPLLRKMLKSQSRQLFIGLKQSHRTTESTITAFVTSLGGDHNSVTKRLASLHETGAFFLQMQRREKCRGSGQAYCRSQKPASGREWMLGNPKRKGRNEVLKQTCRTSLLRRWVTFREHGQLKGWQPLFQPTVAKSLISTMVHWFATVTCHNWEHNHCIVKISFR